MSAGEGGLKARVLPQVLALVEIPYNSVYSYADIFFDKKELSFGDQSIQSQVEFMHCCRLKDMRFSNLADPHYFIITNARTNKSIHFSNRQSTRGELRGAKLVDLLQQASTKLPNKTLFDFLNYTVKSKQYSDLYAMIKQLLCSKSSQLQNNVDTMNSLHFDFLCSLLINHVDTQVRQKKVNPNVNPGQIRNDLILKQVLLAGVNLSELYDLSLALCSELAVLQGAQSLKMKAFPQARELISSVGQRLNDTIIAFCAGELAMTEFFATYIDCVSQATRDLVTLIESCRKSSSP